MSKNALEIVNDLSDLDAVRFVQFLGGEIFEGITGKEVIANIPQSFHSIPGLKELQNLQPDQKKMDLPPQKSIKIARDLLSYFAQDEALGPILETLWEKYKNESDELFIGAVLASGFVAGMILLAATTEIEGKIGNIKFKKKVASPEIVEALAKAAFDSLRQILTGF